MGVRGRRLRSRLLAGSWRRLWEVCPRGLWGLSWRPGGPGTVVWQAPRVIRTAAARAPSATAAGVQSAPNQSAELLILTLLKPTEGLRDGQQDSNDTRKREKLRTRAHVPSGPYREPTGSALDTVAALLPGTQDSDLKSRGNLELDRSSSVTRPNALCLANKKGGLQEGEVARPGARASGKAEPGPRQGPSVL